MFDFPTVLMIFAATLPGMILMIPRSQKELEGLMAGQSASDKKIPPRPVLTLLQAIQSLVLAGGLAVAGGLTAPRAGLAAPVFAAIAGGSPASDALPAPVPVMLITLGGASVFLASYYGFLRRWIGRPTATAMDALRNRLGLGLRILYGGIVEEVLIRWGLMSLIAWLVGLVLPQTVSIWIAIVVAGVLFALGHLPSQVAAGAERSARLIITQIVLNLWLGVMFGYLYWQYGLAAAMVSHALFHLIWYPIDAMMEHREKELPAATS